MDVEGQKQSLRVIMTICKHDFCHVLMVTALFWGSGSAGAVTVCV